MVHSPAIKGRPSGRPACYRQAASSPRRRTWQARSAAERWRTRLGSILVNTPGLAVTSNTDRPPQCPGINQSRNDSLSHADQSEHEKLSVVEDSERLHTGCPKSEEQNLNNCHCAHQNSLDCVVNSRIGDPQLFGHRHHRCADHEDLNPREMVFTPLDQDGPWVREDESPGYEKSQNIQEPRYVSFSA